MKKLFNFLLIISNILILSACIESDDIDSIEISDFGLTTDLNKSGKYDLEISGIKNVVTIKSNNIINNLKISGVKNTVYIEPNTSVSNFTVSGTENIIYVPLKSNISFTDTGEGNKQKTRTTNKILGSWSYIDKTDADTKCEGKYLFKEKGIFSGKVQNKIISGTYSFEKTVVTGTKHSLRVTFFTYNALAGCNGSNSDKIGKTEIIYINFSNSNESKKMEWYTQLTGTTSYSTLTPSKE
jgi:hypothetical protein